MSPGCRDGIKCNLLANARCRPCWQTPWFSVVFHTGATVPTAAHLPRPASSAAGCCVLAELSAFMAPQMSQPSTDAENMVIKPRVSSVSQHGEGSNPCVLGRVLEWCRFFVALRRKNKAEQVGVCNSCLGHAKMVIFLLNILRSNVACHRHMCILNVLQLVDGNYNNNTYPNVPNTFPLPRTKVFEPSRPSEAPIPLRTPVICWTPSRHPNPRAPTTSLLSFFCLDGGSSHWATEQLVECRRRHEMRMTKNWELSPQ